MSNDLVLGTGMTASEIADVEERVRRVTSLLNRSACLWLDIAAEFVEAKEKLLQHCYERFINDAGFTKSVADKLLSVGKCRRLYQKDASDFIGFVDGWSTLYEVSKLEDAQIDLLWEALRAKPSKKLSRSVVQNFANGNSVDDKVIVFASIETHKRKLDALTPLQAEMFSAKLDEINTIFSDVPNAFVLKKRDASVKLLNDIQQSNNAPQLIKTAA